VRYHFAVCLLAILNHATAARGANAKWPAQLPYRVEVEIPAERSWKAHVPVGVSIDFDRDLPKRGASSDRIDPNSILVVARDGSSPIPHRLTGEWVNDRHGKVWWRTPDPSTRNFHIYFDVVGAGRWPVQPKPALVGVADSFLFNNGEPASTTPGDIDWDGDGLPDRLVCRTRVYGKR
jgi:hypothetical protein